MPNIAIYDIFSFMSESAPENQDNITNELLANFSDAKLQRLVGLSAIELVNRGLPLPHSMVALMAEKASDKPRQLINPLLEPEMMPDSVVGDERVVVHHADRQIEVDKKLLAMPLKQFDVFSVLAANADSIVSHDFVLKAVWPKIASSDRDQSNRKIIRPHLCHARSKLGTNDLGHPGTGVVQTVRDVGWVARTSLASV